MKWLKGLKICLKTWRTPQCSANWLRIEKTSVRPTRVSAGNIYIMKSGGSPGPNFELTLPFGPFWWAQAVWRSSWPLRLRSQHSEFSTNLKICCDTGAAEEELRFLVSSRYIRLHKILGTTQRKSSMHVSSRNSRRNLGIQGTAGYHGIIKKNFQSVKPL